MFFLFLLVLHNSHPYISTDFSCSLIQACHSIKSAYSSILPLSLACLVLAMVTSCPFLPCVFMLTHDVCMPTLHHLTEFFLSSLICNSVFLWFSFSPQLPRVYLEAVCNLHLTGQSLHMLIANYSNSE